MRLYRLLADGRRQIIAFRSAGDIIGIGSYGKQVGSPVVMPVTRGRFRLHCLSPYPRISPFNQYLNLLTNELAEARYSLVLSNDWH
jgi:hypothetical protein